MPASHQVDQNKALVYFLYGHCKIVFCMYLNSCNQRILEIRKKSSIVPTFSSMVIDGKLAGQELEFRLEITWVGSCCV